VIYALLLIFLLAPLHAQSFRDEHLPDLGISQDTVIKARVLKLSIEKLASDFNGDWEFGQHIKGGCYGDWNTYNELVGTWARLTNEQEPGTLDIELIRVKAKMVEVVDELGDCLKLITDDLKKIKKATKSLPPK